jgi:hypothetical protein
MRAAPHNDRGSGRTLGQLVIAKTALVAICGRCKHRRVLYPANYIARFREDCPDIVLRERLRCSVAGVWRTCTSPRAEP